MAEDRNPDDFTPDQTSFLHQEAEFVWDRNKQLQDKNKTITETVLKLYSVLLVFAAAPFTREGFLETGFSRVWGLGGVWLALAAWIYADRAFRAYGTHLVEQVFCIRQIAQIREMLMGNSAPYRRLSLSPSSRPESYKLSNTSSSQIKYTAYFYKLLSFFTPMYLCLFLCMIVFPDIMLNPKIHATRSIYLRLCLGCSVVYFFWLGSSMKRCYGLQKQAYRARRVSPDDFWPDFPKEHTLYPVASKEGEKRWEKVTRRLRKFWWPWRKWAKWSLGALCYLVSVYNVARFIELSAKAPTNVIAPIVAAAHDVGAAAHDVGAAGRDVGAAAHEVGAAAHDVGAAAHEVGAAAHDVTDADLKAYWWHPQDSTLSLVTLVLFFIRLVVLEVDLRAVVKVAAEQHPVRSAIAPGAPPAARGATAN